MKILYDMEPLLSAPFWAQILIALFLIVYSICSVYGRINLKFGAKAFRRIDPSQIRKNKSHIMIYTIIPVLITIRYLWLLFELY